MAFTRTFIKSLSGGFIIGLGGAVFLSQENKFLGALMFSLGLLAICVTDQYLFTGKVSYTSDKLFLVNVLIGNYIGATLIGLCLHCLKPEYVEKASDICAKKAAEGFLVIPLGILCNILIYLAVEGYKKGQTILLILCVMAFILCGFEHCVANMFYFAVAGMVSKVPFILFNVLGNAIGGVIVYQIRKVQ